MLFLYLVEIFITYLLNFLLNRCPFILAFRVVLWDLLDLEYDLL